MMINIILGVIILLILAFAGVYIYKQKKNGSACIGCPNAKTCVKCMCECKDNK